MPQITGVKFVSIDGDRVRAKDDSVDFDFGGFEATPVMANGRPAGPVYKGKESRLEFTQAHASDVDEDDLRKRIPRTVVVETDTGRAYLMPNAYLAETVKLNGGEGDMPLVFFGEEVEVIA